MNTEPEQPVNDSENDLRLLRIFNYYRTILSCALLTLYFNQIEGAFVTLDFPQLFLTVNSFYLLFNIALIFLLRQRTRLNNQHIIANIMMDIGAITLLAFAAGGTASGLSNLIVFPIAAGSILLRGSFALLFAAAATIILLLIEGYRSVLIPGSSQQYFQAGVLGIVFFTTALFVKYISRRIRGSEQLAEQRAVSIAHLEQLNRLIIQRMHTGILVVTPMGQIKMYNESAAQLLGDASQPGSVQGLINLPSALKTRLGEWQEHQLKRSTPFRTHSDNPEIQANFAPLQQQDDSDILVFLEDTGKAQQQAQQLKLASLGQLTASIAHEIRNPMGAISHAAQLLNESTELSSPDQRLATIIQDNCQRMNSTIENILELSRRRRSSPQQIELLPWLEQFSQTFRQTENQAFEFKLTVEPYDLIVQFDPSQLQQVLNNLCHNGVRYASQSPSPQLILKTGITSNEHPYLDIIDNGPGIAPERLQHLFEPFFTTEHKGTGLGLYISKELCEANNARLSHQADYNSGCCFRIIFTHPKRVIS